MTAAAAAIHVYPRAAAAAAAIYPRAAAAAIALKFHPKLQQVRNNKTDIKKKWGGIRACARDHFRDFRSVSLPVTYS